MQYCKTNIFISKIIKITRNLSPDELNHSLCSMKTIWIRHQPGFFTQTQINTEIWLTGGDVNKTDHQCFVALNNPLMLFFKLTSLLDLMSKCRARLRTSNSLSTRFSRDPRNYISSPMMLIWYSYFHWYGQPPSFMLQMFAFFCTSEPIVLMR